MCLRVSRVLARGGARVEYTSRILVQPCCCSARSWTPDPSRVPPLLVKSSPPPGQRMYWSRPQGSPYPASSQASRSCLIRRVPFSESVHGAGEWGVVRRERANFQTRMHSTYLCSRRAFSPLRVHFCPHCSPPRAFLSDTRSAMPETHLKRAFLSDGMLHSCIFVLASCIHTVPIDTCCKLAWMESRGPARRPVCSHSP